MNVEQQQFAPAAATRLTPPNFHRYSATTANATTTSPPATATASSTTYVTIGVLPHPGHSLSAAITPPTTCTSSFKATPLLPMPSLEDIECGARGSGGGSGEAAGVGSIVIVGGGAPDGNMLPPGILKYSAASPAFPATAAITGAPLMRVPSPPPATTTPATHVTVAATTDTCGSLSKSNNKLLATATATAQQCKQQQHRLPAPGLLSTSSTICSNIAGSSYCSSSAINSAANNSNPSGKRHRSRRKCCPCFGAAPGEEAAAGEGSGRQTTSTKYSAAQKKTRRSQTLCAGLLTNLGICALLLAYTLLGSFIFLTIENEDSSLLHQQRTLASTKRVAGLGESSTGAGGRSRNTHHSPAHHLDNGTVAAVSSPSASSSSSSSASSSFMTVSSASAGPSAINSNHEFGIADSQLELAAETFDVRQRTIENIWDITVSLNILYKENWTKLAALEIAKFQDQLVKRLNEDALLQLTQDGEAGATGNRPATEAVLLLSPQRGLGHRQQQQHEWNFAKAFLYSLTVLTTIGYGNIAPKTTLGRLVTLAYAILGIPLTLVYLSSTGGLLAKVAREVFSKALCCCLCSNCGYCCYDEKRMAEKERRTKRKRQQEELRKQQAAMQEPYYVRSGSLHGSCHSPEKHAPPGNTPMMPAVGVGTVPDIDSLSASESRGSMHGLSILAPILLCLSMMIIYILFGAVVLYRLENWPLLDGVYFCFMSLSTIGFGDLVPGLRKESTTTTWFCSIYIMSGMALTAMCFNVIHEEIVHRLKIVVEFKKGSALDSMNEEQNYFMGPPPA